MTAPNTELADRLAELAALLRLGKGDRFRVRAYERAARVVRAAPVDLAALDDAEVRRLEGIGPAIAGIIAEHTRTGRIALLDELRAQEPPGSGALLGLPLLGIRDPACWPGRTASRRRRAAGGRGGARRAGRAGRPAGGPGPRVPPAAGRDRRRPGPAAPRPPRGRRAAGCAGRGARRPGGARGGRGAPRGRHRRHPGPPGGHRATRPGRRGAAPQPRRRPRPRAPGRRGPRARRLRLTRRLLWLAAPGAAGGTLLAATGSPPTSRPCASARVPGRAGCPPGAPRARSTPPSACP